jgi:O-antigen/teichoic acid export membrane protein
VAKIGRLSSIYLFGSLVPPLISMVLLRVFTKYLVPEQMGIVTLAARVAGPIGIAVQLCLSSGLRMHYFRVDEPLRPQLLRTMLLGQMGVSAIMCILLSVAGIWVAGWALPNLPLSPEYVFGLWLMVVWGCFFTGLIDLATYATQLMERATTSVSLSFLLYLSQTGLGVLAVVALGWHGFGRQGTIFVGAIIAAAAAMAILWRYGRGSFDAKMFWRVGGAGLTFIPHNMANNLQFALNAWLLNALISPGCLAVYGIALAFASLIDMPLLSLTNAAYPTLARLMNDGSAEARRQQARLYTFLAIGIAVLSLGSVLFSPIAIRLLTTPAYHEAANVVAILILAWLFQGLYNLVLQPLFYFGGGFGVATASISAIIATGVFSWLLIPQWGMYGAAWAVVGCFAIKFVVAAAVSSYLYRLPWELSKIVRALACAGVLAGLDLWFVSDWGLAAAIALKCGLVLAIVPALWLVRVVSLADILRLKGLVLTK